MFTRSDRRLRAGQIVAWWEARRLLYNVIVGTAGVVGAAAMIAVGGACESRGGVAVGLPDPPLFAVVAVLLYGIMANVCYTGGWVTELLVAKLWRIDTTSFGPIALVLGTAFSVLVTLAPAGAVVVVALITSCRGF